MTQEEPYKTSYDTLLDYEYHEEEVIRRVYPSHKIEDILEGENQH